jgi:6-phosphogluconolactonase
MKNPLGRVMAAVALGVVCAANLFGADVSAPANAQEFFVYFGTYTNDKSKGIYRARLTVDTGKLSPAELAAECPDPSFLAVHPKSNFLYAIDEGSDPAKTPTRGVSGFALDRATGALTPLNSQSAGSPGPCHLAVDHEGRCVLVANYSGGSVAALPLAADGRLGAPTAVLKHTGSSVNPARQKEPHAHVVTVSPDNHYVLAADLGIDKVLVYRLDAKRAALAPNDPPAAVLPPGSGPRHVAFHPNGKFVYVINELLCTVAAFRFDAARGTLSELQVVSTLPAGETVKPGYSTAEVAVHPSGKFLYGSNRGHDSIVVFAIDAATGRLTPVEHQSTQGHTPRHFALDPSGTWLLAENQASDSVVVFRIDPRSGRLTPTGQTLAVPSPVCAVFVRSK